MNYALYFVASVVLSLPVLWVLFLAVMNLKRAKEAGMLSTAAAIIGYPVVWLAYLIDAYCNTFFFTVVMWELPQWQNGEILVTDRLKRTRKTGSGWRKAIADSFVPLLNPYDENHI